MRTFFTTSSHIVQASERTPADWVKMARDILALEDGWDRMKEGVKISRDTVDAAIRPLFVLRDIGFSDFRLQPGLAGEVLIIGDSDEKSVEIVVSHDLMYEFYLEEHGIETHESMELGFSQLAKKILEKCHTSESSAPNITTTQRSEGSQGWHSGRPAMEESQSLRSGARFQLAGQSVNTYRHAIPA